MKLAFAILAAIATLLPAVAHADNKAEAVLKEARLRMSKANTYSASIRMEQDPKRQIRFYLQRPDKFRLELIEPTRTGAIIMRGAGAVMVRNGEMAPVSASTARNTIDAIYSLISANFEKAIKEPYSTTYVTQKMLDEKTVVDVIEIKGQRSKSAMRLYIDNNSLLRKAITSGGGMGTVMHFTNVTIDEPIPESKFQIK